MIIYIIAAVVAIIVFIKWKEQKSDDFDALPKYFADKNWRDDDKRILDHSVNKFVINFSDDELKYLNHRLDLTRFPVKALRTSKLHYGVREEMMRNLVEYWRDDYSWKDQEKMMNSFSHFKTNIEGLDVHFIHEKPKQVSKGVEPKVVLLSHGWPGSFVEYLETIKRLTDPRTYHGNETEVFTAVCPSIPGYGFSDHPQKEGFNAYECARIFHKLMLRLGYKKYYVAGGDWGALISSGVSLMYPSYVSGCYTTMGISSPHGFGIVKAIVASYIPWLFYSKQEVLKFHPVGQMFSNMIQETGYMHIQATKPDTVGFGLSDSPVGMAAYIIEKFSSWTDLQAKDSDDGLLSKHWTNDQLLNNVMIYWWSGNMTPSMRFYKENITQKLKALQRMKVRVPAGFAWYPDEFMPTCKSWIKQKYSNLVHFTYMKCGGHFNAYQCPDDFADDFKLFVRTVGDTERSQAAYESDEVKDIKSSQLDRFEIDGSKLRWK